MEGIIGKIYNYKLGKKQVESREIIKKEKERQEILMRRDAMFERIKALPVTF